MKTEKEKMLAGELYRADDPELTAERILSRQLVYDFNHSRTDELEKRTAILKKLLRARGNVFIEPPFYCDYGFNISVGDNFFANYNCVILDVNRVTIGDNVMFGPAVQVYSATHPTDPLIRRSGLELGLPITIGNDVWIGGGSIICPGVTIGDNVTIGAGSVVTRDIPSNVVAVGNPCRVIRRLEVREE